MKRLEHPPRTRSRAIARAVLVAALPAAWACSGSADPTSPDPAEAVRVALVGFQARYDRVRL